MTEEHALERVSLTVLDKVGRVAALAPFGDSVAAEATHLDAVSEPSPWGDEANASAPGSLVTADRSHWK